MLNIQEYRQNIEDMKNTLTELRDCLWIRITEK
jgi:hypothetical protein